MQKEEENIKTSEKQAENKSKYSNVSYFFLHVETNKQTKQELISV